MNIESLFNRNLYLTQAQPPGYIFSDIEEFDKDGFELSSVEAELYENHGLNVTQRRGHRAYRFDWEHESLDKSLVHHSYLMARFGFDGALAEQIQQSNTEGMNYLFQIKPKLGLDINIEYTFEDGYVMDVLHVEYDYQYNARCFSLFSGGVHFWEQNIKSINWVEAAHELRDLHNEWEHLTGDDENDYKARFFGLDRAYRTHKVI